MTTLKPWTPYATRENVQRLVAAAASLLRAERQPVFLEYAAGSDSPLAVTTSVQDVDATNLAATFTFPPSGAVRVDVSLFVTMSGSATVQVCVRENTTTVAQRPTVLTETRNGKIAASVRLTGTPGSTHTYKAAVLASANSIAVVQSNSVTGRYNTIGVIPL